MIIKKIRLNNFLSHKDTTVELKNNQKLLIDGKSGAGKSSIVEALLWGFYGRGRSDNRSLIKGNEKIAKVTIVLEDGGDTYRVIREINIKGKHDLKIAKVTESGVFKPIKITGLKQLQEFIEKDMLSSSYLLFVNSIIYPQDNSDNFINQPASKRKELLMEIIKADKYDDLYREAHSTLDKLTLDRRDLEATLSVLKSQIVQDKLNADYSAIEQDIKKIKVKLIEIKTEQKKLGELKINMELHKTMYAVGENAITEAEEELIKLNADIDMLSRTVGVHSSLTLSDRMRDLQANWKKAEQWEKDTLAIIQLHPVSRAFDSELEELNLQLIDAMKSSKQDKPYPCPKCGHDIDKADVCGDIMLARTERERRRVFLESRLQIVEAEKKEYIKDVEKYEMLKEKIGDKPAIDLNEMNDLADKIIANKTLKENKDKIKNLTIRLNDDRKELHKLKFDKNEYDLLVKQNNKLIDQIDELTEKKSELDGQLSFAKEAEKRLTKTKEELKAREKELAALSTDIENLSMLKDAFSPNGIRAIIVDHIIPKLEDRINNILGMLSDFRIRLDTQRKGITKDTIVEGLFINIYNERGDQFDFDSYSGGERLKIVVAISEALAEIQKAKFRVLDELFVGLDEESIENFAGVINVLQQKFNQLICISHLNNIKDMFDERIDIIKIDGTSQIK